MEGELLVFSLFADSYCHAEKNDMLKKYGFYVFKFRFRYELNFPIIIEYFYFDKSPEFKKRLSNHGFGLIFFETLNSMFLNNSAPILNQSIWLFWFLNSWVWIGRVLVVGLIVENRGWNRSDASRIFVAGQLMNRWWKRWRQYRIWLFWLAGDGMENGWINGFVFQYE